MTTEIAPTGFWVSYEDYEHVFIKELSDEINSFSEEHNVKSVYDFGCGRGEYLHELTNKYGHIEAIGFEGFLVDGLYNNIVKKDLSEIIDLDPVDLVISFEVGEHIPKEFEQNFIDNICKSAKSYVILSWAIEGQYGTGHINCQNNDYIISEMEKRGWLFDATKTLEARNKMPKSYPGDWFNDTLMFFTNKDMLTKENI